MLAGAASLMVWDSMFFGRIAQEGYEYEQFYAFFPLFPIVVRALVAFGAPEVDSACDIAYAAMTSAA